MRSTLYGRIAHLLIFNLAMLCIWRRSLPETGIFMMQSPVCIGSV